MSTKEAMENATNVPFTFRVPGSDVLNPLESAPVFAEEVRVKKGDKVGYASMEVGELGILPDYDRRREIWSVALASDLRWRDANL